MDDIMGLGYSDEQREKMPNETTGNKSALSAGLDGLVSELRILADQFEKEYCKENKDRFAEGRFEGKMEAYNDCIEKIESLTRKAD